MVLDCLGYQYFTWNLRKNKGDFVGQVDSLTFSN
jgi:hypothetical protein